MAINQIDRELNDRLMSYANTLARGDRALEQTLRQQARTLGAAQEDVLAEYEDYLNKSRGWHGKEAEEAKARLIRLRKLEQESVAAQQEGINAKIEHNKKLKQFADDEARLTASASSMSAAELARRRTDLAQRKADAITSFKDATRERTAKYRLGMNAAAERRAFENRELSATAKWGNAFRGSLSSVAQGALNRAFGSLSVAQAFERLWVVASSAVQAGAKHGTGVSINPFNNDSAISVFGAARAGYNTDEWMKMINNPETQRAIRSSQRGLFDFADGLRLAEKDFSHTITDSKERSELARKNMELMASSGIRARYQDAVAFKGDMERLRKINGESYENFNNSIANIAADEDVRAQLKAATSEAERRAIMDGIASQYAQSRAMGMTTEEAKNAAKALAKLAGEKPLERFKKAAKLRAFGAAMGMGAESNRLADLEIKGKRRTAAENTEYQQIAGQLSERLTQTGTGSYEGEIFATQLADKLQLEQMLGPSSPFNNTLGNATKPLEDATKTLDTFPDKLNQVFSTLNTILSSVGNNDLLKIAGGTLAGLGAWKLGGAALSSAGSMLGGAATSAGTAAAGIGAGTLAAGTAALTAGGTALYSGYKFAKGEDASNWISDGFDKLSGGWNMFEAMDKLVGGPLSKSTEQINQTLKPAVATAALQSDSTKTPVSPPPTPTAEIKKKEPTAPIPPTVNADKKSEQEKAEAVKQEATLEAVNNGKEQVKKITTSNELLQQIAETTQRQVELAEKQLVATTLSDSERADSTMRANLRKDNRFGSQYGYA